MTRSSYQEVRELVEEMGGVMKWVQHRAGQSGTWVICVGKLIGIFPYDKELGDFPGIYGLYLYHPDGSFELRPDARERIVKLLE
ncbi:MAG: hypothetical protein F4Z82_10660 [Caldilineaceae bacterium SB0668_bin_21]|nr:hypothetical protein [Caldilineaceae bacterium SB0668_bin_21]MYC21398.1 hypothetical protein [Caldilineaceae bacterium SB0662_bin_25]